MRRFAAVMASLSAVLLIACSGSSSASPTPTATIVASSPVPTVVFSTTQIRIDAAQSARTIDVEVAATDEQSQRGLGYRDTLASDAGMIFDLGPVRIPTFWMKGMRFPLDMVWIGADRRVAGVTPDIPPQPGATDAQLKRYSPDVGVRYVLELNAGAAARLGIAAGVQLTFSLP